MHRVVIAVSFYSTTIIGSVRWSCATHSSEPMIFSWTFSSPPHRSSVRIHWLRWVMVDGNFTRLSMKWFVVACGIILDQFFAVGRMVNGQITFIGQFMTCETTVALYGHTMVYTARSLTKSNLFYWFADATTVSFPILWNPICTRSTHRLICRCNGFPPSPSPPAFLFVPQLFRSCNEPQPHRVIFFQMIANF